MDTNEQTLMWPKGNNLFDRVVSILEQARSNVVRAVNNNMVIAHWLIGREIVQEIQGGDERAEYGKQVIEQLSAKLNHKYGRGFSTTNLRYFRTFYTVYFDRIPEIRHIGSGEFKAIENRHTQSGVLDVMALAVEQAGIKLGFSPNLSIRSGLVKCVDSKRNRGFLCNQTRFQCPSVADNLRSRFEDL